MVLALRLVFCADLRKKDRILFYTTLNDWFL